MGCRFERDLLESLTVLGSEPGRFILARDPETCGHVLLTLASTSRVKTSGSLGKRNGDPEDIASMAKKKAGRDKVMRVKDIFTGGRQQKNLRG